MLGKNFWIDVKASNKPKEDEKIILRTKKFGRNDKAKICGLISTELLKRAKNCYWNFF
jgi:alanine racemase